MRVTPILGETFFLSGREDIYACDITRRVAGGKATVQVLLTLVIWSGLSLITLEIMSVTKVYYLIILMILELLSIIPAMIWIIKNQRKLRQKSSEKFYTQFYARDGELYINGGYKLNVIRNTKKKQLILDDLKTSKTTFYAAAFTATVDGADVDGFTEFCSNNGINIGEI